MIQQNLLNLYQKLSIKEELASLSFQPMDKKVREITKVLDNLFPNPKIALNYSNIWQLYVAVVLSAQSTDKKVNEMTRKLFKKHKTVEDYKNATMLELQNDIKQIGLFRNKAKNIIKAAEIIDAKHKGKVPKKDWKKFNLQMVLYGRQYCSAHCKHTNCPLKKSVVKLN